MMNLNSTQHRKYKIQNCSHPTFLSPANPKSNIQNPPPHFPNPKFNIQNPTLKMLRLLLAALLLCSCASTAPRPVAQRTTSFEKQTLVGEAPAPVSDKERDE